MSHIVTAKLGMTNETAINRACARCKLKEPVRGTHRVYGGNQTGLAVQLPGWSYPLVIDTETGNANYDNYGGSWGSDKELDKFKQAYAIEKTKLAAYAQGLNVVETPLEDGSVKLAVVYA